MNSTNKGLPRHEPFFSYLLAQGRPGVPVRVVRAALHGEFEAIVGITTVNELIRSVESKSWLRQNILPDQLNALTHALRTLEMAVAEPDQPIPMVSRDFDDDYLIALSVKHNVDYLVSGDKGVRIVSPATFVAILDRSAVSTSEP